MTVSVTVLTTTIPGREYLLARCIESVNAQTLPVEAHLVFGGPKASPDLVQPVIAERHNRLLAAANTEWVCVLNDDNLLLSHHIETLWPATEDADFIWSWDGNNDRCRVDMTNWSQQQIVDTLDGNNFIDASGVLIRTEFLRKVGGWPKWEGGHFLAGGRFAGTNANCEDWAMNCMMAKAGARFVCVPKETWLYTRDATDRISDMRQP